MNNHLVPPCLCVLNEALLLVVLRANVLRGRGVRGRVWEVALLVNSETTNMMFENRNWSKILSKCSETCERIAGPPFSRCSQWEEFWRHRTGRPLVAPPFSFQIESLPAKLSCSSHRGEVKAFGHIGGRSDSVRKRLLLTKPDKMSYFYFTETKIGGGWLEWLKMNLGRIGRKLASKCWDVSRLALATSSSPMSLLLIIGFPFPSNITILLRTPEPARRSSSARVIFGENDEKLDCVETDLIVISTHHGSFNTPQPVMLQPTRGPQSPESPEKDQWWRMPNNWREYKMNWLTQTDHLQVGPAALYNGTICLDPTRHFSSVHPIVKSWDGKCCRALQCRAVQSWQEWEQALASYMYKVIVRPGPVKCRILCHHNVFIKLYVEELMNT